jgi:hypothetical protein
MSLYLPLFKALDDAGVKYVVVGGLATVLHGYARLTTDIDLIVDLVPDEAARTIRTLESLGFLPRLPVPAAQFADAEKRREWIEQKGMRVFSFHNPVNPMLSIDLFVEHPIPFDDLRSRAVRLDIDGVAVYICSIDDLIVLKQQAGRPQDLQDIERLQRIKAKRQHGDQ